MSIHTLTQERADFALQSILQVEQYFPRDAKKRAEYSTLVRSLPAMLRANGLGSTLAFLSAKAEGKPPHDSPSACLYMQISEWIHGKVRWTDQPKNAEELLASLVKQNSSVYRRAGTEAEQLAIWLRRFAEAKNWGDQR